MLSVIYAECHLCWVSSMLSVIYAKCHLCWVSSMQSVIYAKCHLCWVSPMLSVIYAEYHLCWVSSMLSVVMLNVVAPEKPNANMPGASVREKKFLITFPARWTRNCLSWTTTTWSPTSPSTTTTLQRCCRKFWKSRSRKRLEKIMARLETRSLSTSCK